ncbi:MAG: hypothetical protein GY866_23995 [Proteobacteria bacterium]|nr:hypothetical protein [Pseudomonadota bacterium]
MKNNTILIFIAAFFLGATTLLTGNYLIRSDGQSDSKPAITRPAPPQLPPVQDRTKAVQYLLTDEIGDGHRRLLREEGSDAFFDSISPDSDLTLAREIKTTRHISDDFTFDLNATRLQLVFTEKLASDLVLHLKYYVEDDPSLDFDLNEDRLEIGAIKISNYKMKLYTFIVAPSEMKRIGFKLNAAYGEIVSDRLSLADGLEMNLNAGKLVVRLDQLVLSRLVVDSNAGVLNMKTDLLDFSDTVSLENSAGKIEFETGSITGEGKHLNLSVNAGRLDFTIDSLEGGSRDFDLRAMAGSLKLDIDDVDSYLITAAAKMGSVEIATRQGRETVKGVDKSSFLRNGDEKYRFRADVKAGKILLDLD